MESRELAAWNAHESALKIGMGNIDAVLAACNAYYFFNGSQPTALTDEQWELLRNCAPSIVVYPHGGPNDRAVREAVNTILSRSTAEPPANVLYEDSTGGLHCDLDAADPSPAPSGDVIVDQMNSAYRKAQNGLPGGYQMCAAYNVARADLLAHPPAEWLDKRDAEWGAAITHTFHEDWGKSDETTLRWKSEIADHLTPKPVERVTVEHTKEGGWCVRKDGLDLATFIWSEDAERYAAGLRAELAKEAADAK